MYGIKFYNVILFKNMVCFPTCSIFVLGFQIWFYKFLCIVYLSYIVFISVDFSLFCWFGQVSFHAPSSTIEFFL